VTLVSVRPVPNMSPAYQYRVDYVRPHGAVPADAVPVLHPQGSVHGPDDRNYAGYAPGPQPQPQPQPAQGFPGAVVSYPQPPQPQQYAPVMSTATGQPVVHQQAVPMPAPQAAAPQAAPAGFNDEQAALLAKLTGGQAAA
jgi:hypothetical protein